MPTLISTLFCFIPPFFFPACIFFLCCGEWSIFQWSVLSAPVLFISPVCFKDLWWDAPGVFHPCPGMRTDVDTCLDTRFVTQPTIILPAQLTQLDQRTAPHDSLNYQLPRDAPSSCPQWGMFICDRGCVIDSSNVHKHILTHRFGSAGKLAIPPYVHLLRWWLPSIVAVSQLGWFAHKACHLVPHTHPDQSLSTGKLNHQLINLASLPTICKQDLGKDQKHLAMNISIYLVMSSMSQLIKWRLIRITFLISTWCQKVKEQYCFSYFCVCLSVSVHLYVLLAKYLRNQWMAFVETCRK